jgi:hypothetical protein
LVHAPANAGALAAIRPWVWPLPRLDGAAPCVIESASADRPLDGVAIGYRGRSSSSNLVPVFAAQDGVVTYAGTTVGGSAVCIDHIGGWSTRYSMLQHLLTRPAGRYRRRRKERVRAGDIIGHAYRSTLQVRFGISQRIDVGRVEQDLAELMSAWSMLPWFVEPAPGVVTPAAV